MSATTTTPNSNIAEAADQAGSMHKPQAASLMPEDIVMFGRLGVPPELLSEAHVERVSDWEARERYGIRFDAAKDVGGIAFPYFIPAVEYRVTARVRRDRPEMKDGKPQNKYVSPYGDGRHLYFPPDAQAKLDQPDMPIALVESEKAALSLTAFARRTSRKLLPLGMGGCWGWRGQHVASRVAPNGERTAMPGPLSDLNYCNGRTVYILVDSNVATNPNVLGGAFRPDSGVVQARTQLHCARL